MTWLLTHWVEVLVIAGTAVDLLAMLAKFTANTADDSCVASVRDFIKKISV